MNMIELDAKQMSDEIVTQAIALAQEKIDEMCDFQTDYLKNFEITRKEVVYNKPSESLITYVRGLLTQETKNEMLGNTKVSFNDNFNKFQYDVLEQSKELVDGGDDDYTHSKIKMAVFQVLKDVIRDRTMNENLRVDDRGMTDIRPLFTQVDTAPRVHGSGLFWR